MTKPVVDKAVIVGGGLGGLAAAIQLRKIGIDVQVSRLAGYISRQFSFHSLYFTVICLCLEGFSLLAWFDCCLFVSKHLEVPEISLHWKSGWLCKIENRFVKTMIIITSGLGSETFLRQARI
jgi:hypothetical protein